MGSIIKSYISGIYLITIVSFQARVDRSNNITLTWEASCTVIDEPIGYMVTYEDLTSGRSSYASYPKTVNTKLTQKFDTGIKYGTEYEFSVHVDVPLQNVFERPKHSLERMSIESYALAVGLGNNGGSSGLVPQKGELTKVLANFVVANSLSLLAFVELFKGEGLTFLKEVEEATILTL